ncbi:alpha/beta fold hydrolase [Ornithinimicrobium sp. LYQ103]|uniref:alpha/beta fold hydrolase n=1 Tax=Ornithinimicrobium sp. LYQ103 TaxID=3378796 RepID=UPI003852F4F8
MRTARTYAARSISSLMGVPPDLPLSGDDHARLGEELDSIFPAARRARGCLFDAFIGNKAINAIPVEDVRAPTLVIHFRDDTGAPFAGAQTLAHRIPNAQTLFLDHGGHLGLGAHPEVPATLRAFLDKVPPAR